MVATKGEKSGLKKLHIGTIGWSYDFWVGQFYPENMKPEAFLKEYAKHFNTVEVDSTFYRIPSASTVNNWRENTPDGFLFSLKFPRMITHIKMLRDCENETAFFVSRASELKNKLGPLLLQFPRSFGVKNFAALKTYLSELPKSYRYAVEVRNDTWEGKLTPLLRDYGVTQAMTNQLSPKEQSSFIYCRWEGDRRKINGTLGKVEVDRSLEIEKTADQARKLLDQGLEFFGYFSKYFSGYPPKDAEKLLNLLN
jgi:uncharacterized protein YecE (DUF72 family)